MMPDDSVVRVPMPYDALLDKVSALCGRPIKGFGDMTAMEVEATCRLLFDTPTSVTASREATDA